MKRNNDEKAAPTDDKNSSKTVTDDGDSDDDTESFMKRREKEWLAPKSGPRSVRVGENYQCVIPDLVQTRTKNAAAEDST
jgi:hypothetical protein